MPCAKFVIAAIISVGTTVFGIVLLARNGFRDPAETGFATSLIMSNLTYWTDAPKWQERLENARPPI
jgi:hypothetical protein